MLDFFVTLFIIFLLMNVVVSFALFYFVIFRYAKFDIIKKEKAKSMEDVEAYYDQNVPWFEIQNWEHVSITSKDGLTLRGIYLAAKEATDKTVITVHGYRQSGEKEYLIFAHFYHMENFNILIPDDRAHGTSDGLFIGFGWADRLDCIGWINFILDRSGKEHNIMLHGISMGAAAVLMASGEHLPSQVKAIVADCSYTSVWDEFAYQMTEVFHLPVFPLLYTTSIICKVIAGYDFREASAVKQVKKSVTPILFIHGDRDIFVPTYMVNELYGCCRTDKDLLIVDRATHGVSYLYDTKLYKKTILAFAKKYLK